MKRRPNVGEYVRNQGTLVQVEDVTPPPPTTVEHFIFQEINARGELRYEGQLVKELGTYNDFYGLGTSVTGCIEDMEKIAERMHITAASELEIVVVKITTHIRRIAKPHAENFYDPTFHDFESLSSGWGANVPADVLEVVWTTKKPKADVVKADDKENAESEAPQQANIRGERTACPKGTNDNT